MARTASNWRDPALAGFAAAGAASALAGYPPVGWWIAALLGPALLWSHAACREPRRAFAAGMAYGLGFFTALLYWLVGTLHVYGHLPLWSSVAVFALLVAYLALYPAAVAWATARVAEGGGRGWALLFAPVAWTAAQGVRGWLMSGFGWGDLPQALWREGWALDLAPWVGSDGVGLLAALLAVAPAWAATRWGFKRPVSPAVLAAPLVALLIAGTLLALPRPEGEPAGRGRAAVIQGNVPQDEKWDPGRDDEIFARYRRLTLAAAKEAGALDFVLWPETAVPVAMERPSRDRARVLDVAREADAPLVVGAVAYEPAGRGVEARNSVYLVDRRGKLAGRYDKLHLVPFGEFVPLGRYLPFLKKIAAGAGNFTPGTRAVALREDAASVPVGPLVCFESIFPRYAEAQAGEGARVLAVVTNDAWFGETSAPWQHLAYAAWRAAETGLPLVRAANTGVSAVFDARGRLVARTGLMREDYLVADLEYRRPGGTFEGRVRPYVWPVCLALALGGLSVMVRRRSAAG